MGPFAGFADTATDTTRVLRKHRDACAELDEDLVSADLLTAAEMAWDRAVDFAETVGVRNAQATVLAPTGTISFMMDCDTTGIEPDLALVKYKKLVGGGSMSIVNQTIQRALSRLGYDDAQAEDIIGHIVEHGSIIGAPHLASDHLAVFACSMGDNVIHHEGHVKMMGAVQPFLSGAISKTVNLPETASVGDIEDLHLLSWELGLKAVAVYRDNCKVAQPMSTDKGSLDAVRGVVSGAELEEMLAARAPERESLPRQRNSRTFSFRVADCHGFMTVGEYDNGRPGEIFLTVAKQGSTLAGIMNAFAISVSHGLQYGVPLKAYVEAYANVRFEPAGITDDPDLRIATSLVDYIFRRLALEYLSMDERVALGILATEERTEPTLPGTDTASVPNSIGSQMAADPAPRASASGSAPMCFTCGDTMTRAGSCYTCRSCGSSSGCS